MFEISRSIIADNSTCMHIYNIAVAFAVQPVTIYPCTRCNITMMLKYCIILFYSAVLAASTNCKWDQVLYAEGSGAAKQLRSPSTTDGHTT